MFNSEILEVGIGMVFLFLLISLICAAIKEWLEGIFKWRAMDLERALRGLLADQDGTLLSALLRHPLLDSLFQGKYQHNQLRSSWLTPGQESRHMRMSQRRHLPSYIPSAQFAVALLDMAARGPLPAAAGDPPGTQPISLESLRQSVPNLPSPHLQRVLLSALDYAAGDLERVKHHLEQWFDASMDRAAGWYKRRTQALLFVLGLAAAVLLNIDAIHVMERLTLDKTLREVVVKEAGAPSVPPASASAAQGERIAEARRALEKIGVPIGWKERTRGGVVQTLGGGAWTQMVPLQLCMENGCERAHYFGADWIAAATGWLVTAFAVMLGAPFWFDLLNKFMVIRSTVKPHEKSPEEGSEDHPA